MDPNVYMQIDLEHAYIHWIMHACCRGMHIICAAACCNRTCMKWHHIAGSVLHLAGWSFLLKCSFVLYRDGSMSRRSNAATGKDLLKTFRGNLTAVEAGDALLSLDGFCKKHSVLMKEILSITSRPTAAVMHEALGLVWPGAPALELKTFANHLHEVFKTLFTKTRNMSTGGRLPDSVQDMCFFIKQELLGGPSSSPGKTEQQGSKRASSCSAKSKASPKKKLKQKLDTTCQKASTRKLEVHVSVSSEDPPAVVKKEKSEPSASSSGVPKPLPTGEITKKYQQAAASASSFFHTDSSVPTVVRISGDSREAATMHKGPSGFAVAVWSDGHQIVSEIPNLMLEKAAAAEASAAKASAPKAAKAKAASKKKPAAVIKKPACRPDVQDDVQDDDGEESTPDVATDEDPAAAEDGQAPAEAPAAIVPAEAPDAEAPDQPLEVFPEDRSLRKEYRTANNSMAFRMVWREKGEECKKQLFQLHGGTCSKEQLHQVGSEVITRCKAGERLSEVRQWGEEKIASMQAAV